MSSISFDNVYLLLIAIPILAVVVVPFALAVRKDNRNGHSIASLALHILMAVVIAFAAAGTAVVTVITETNVFVVADVSYSANKNLDTVDGYINKLRGNLPRNSKIGIVCFGKDYELLTEMGGDIKSVKDSDVDQTETNISSALKYTGTLFKEDVLKRIVLISDGRQSDLRDANSLKRTVDELASDNIKVDAIYLNDNLSDDAREVQVTSAEYTKTAFLNNSEEATVYVQSSYSAGNVDVSLYKGGELSDKRMVSLSPGSNTVVFKLDTSEEGEFDYEVRVDAEEDESEYNNTYKFTQKVSGAVSVLLITGDQSNEAAVQEMYGDKSTVDSYVLGPNPILNNVPMTIGELCAYDEIILADADVSTINNYTMFIENLDTTVSLFGKSLIVTGETYIQNREDAVLKRLEDMLPLRYGNNDQDKRLFTIVIDASRSMETNYRMQIAKTAATQLIQFLGDGDTVCVVLFHGDVEVLQQPSATLAVNRDSIIESINNYNVTQGTIIYRGLEQALNQMYRLTQYSEKQVMLISDGLSYSGSGGKDDAIDIVNKMRAYNIQVSALDVGRGGDTTSSASVSAKLLMENIAKTGNGQYYFASSLEQLDGVLFGEFADNVTESVIERPSKVNASRVLDDVLADVNLDGDYVNGFVNSSAKASAITALTVDYTKENTGVSIPVPLYTYWGYGNGKVACFTSKLAGGWVANFDNSRKLFDNVFTTGIPDEKSDYPFTYELSEDGKFTGVKLTPVEYSKDAAAKIEVTLPGGEVIQDELVSDGITYSFEFASGVLGKYGIKIIYAYDGNEYVAETAINVSYYAEYDAFANFDASELYKMVGGSGQVSEDGSLKIENDEKDVGTYVLKLTVPLMIACVVLFVADIVVRKLKWNDIKNLFIRVKK